jgi:hypothetical protein
MGGETSVPRHVTGSVAVPSVGPMNILAPGLPPAFARSSILLAPWVHISIRESAMSRCGTISHATWSSWPPQVRTGGKAVFSP